MFVLPSLLLRFTRIKSLGGKKGTILETEIVIHGQSLILSCLAFRVVVATEHFDLN